MYGIVNAIYLKIDDSDFSFTRRKERGKGHPHLMLASSSFSEYWNIPSTSENLISIFYFYGG